MRIQNKLFAIFFLTSAILVVAQVLVMQWSIGKGMIDYVNERELKALSGVATSLSEIYQNQQSWEQIRGNHQRFKKIIDQGLSDSEFRLPQGKGPPPQSRGPRPQSMQGRPDRSDKEQGRQDRGPGRPDSRQGRPVFNAQSESPISPPPGRGGPPSIQVSYALLDLNKSLIAGKYSDELGFSYIDILANEKIVGFLAVSKRDHLTTGYELNFVEQQQRYILFIALGLVIVAMLIAMPLAAHFVKPIKRLTLAMSKLTSGDFHQRIDLKRKDEFAHLSRDFNELAATLQQNEQARKRWLADISHELRTPVAVLKGELEAMLDGVRPVSLERIQSVNEEVKQLEQLLDDLHELTRSDLGTLHYRKESLNLQSLLKESVNHYQSLLAESGFKVTFSELPGSLWAYADSKRLRQLFGNLFINTAKYATDGDLLKISINVLQPSQQIEIIFEDNGCGVDEANMSKLFEHLFRVENSRNRETGGSGLGLSICQKIVEAHHGKISAFSSDLGGLGILITLPME
jgi:two-component system sensor histidine kinase BaeS